MDIQSFFQLSIGRWFMQRTSYSFVSEQSAVKTGELHLEKLESSDLRITQVCKEAGIDLAAIQGSFTTTWNETTLGQPPLPQKTAILIPQSTSTSPLEGILLRSTPLLVSTYVMGDNQSLILTQTTETHHCTERIWFASNNLRLRTTVIHAGQRCLLSSSCSEVRLGVKPEPEPTTATTEAR